MQNVTRTMTEYEVTAYSVCESDGEVGLNVVAECTVHSTTMNKGEARAALMRPRERPSLEDARWSGSP